MAKKEVFDSVNIPTVFVSVSYVSELQRRSGYKWHALGALTMQIAKLLNDLIHQSLLELS